MLFLAMLLLMRVIQTIDRGEAYAETATGSSSFTLTRYENTGLGLIELTKEKNHTPYELAWASDFYVTKGIINRKIRFIRRLRALERRIFHAMIAVMPIIQPRELQAHLNLNEIMRFAYRHVRADPS